jgi:hypothetical protein
MNIKPITHSLLASVALLAVASMPSVTAQTFYHDSFSGSYSDINGQEPDVTDTLGNTYTTAGNAGDTFTASGGVASPNDLGNESAGYATAFLPVNGTSGVILTGLANFTLSVDIGDFTGDGYAGLDLDTAAPTFAGQESTLAFLEVESGRTQSFYGSGFSNYLGATTPTQGAGVVNTYTLAYNALAGTIDYEVNGTSYATETGVTATDVAAVTDIDFAVYNETTPVFDNFILTQAVPEPATYALLMGGALLLLVAKRPGRDFTAARRGIRR